MTAHHCTTNRQRCRLAARARCMVSFFEKNFWLLFREKRRCCAMIPAGVLGRASALAECLLSWKSESRVCTYRTPQAAIKSHWQKFKRTTALHLSTYLYIVRKGSLSPPARARYYEILCCNKKTKRGHVSRDATLILDQLEDLFQNYGLLFYVSY